MSEDVPRTPHQQLQIEQAAIEAALDPRSIRLHCLKIAAQTNLPAGDVLPTAKLFADFVLGSPARD
ncbi:hypothetical protein PX554_13675 [Sphingomonas sp. H39-1-10]|uniref:hypothetical protein n=1 Tax=Sphingomonas pollutisoli TaxID=3030829 RepID=UPI0023B8C724|nr:hypothetical protein [Sphingomonas pollutisoli]MDF0489185.1 hypothetical protein [Sphingomonas pollutisoli]